MKNIFALLCISIGINFLAIPAFADESKGNVKNPQACCSQEPAQGEHPGTCPDEDGACPVDGSCPCQGDDCHDHSCCETSACCAAGCECASGNCPEECSCCEHACGGCDAGKESREA